jgi:hypothetical protein
VVVPDGKRDKQDKNYKPCNYLTTVIHF